MTSYKFPTREFSLINNDNGTSITMGGSNPNNPAIPVNYQEIETVLKRSMENYGVITEVSSEYTFVNESASFLRAAYDIRDIEANVDLIEYRFNPNTDVKYVYNTSNADFSTYSQEKNKVNLSFKSSGLNSLIRSKQKEKFDLERIEDINGNAITPIQRQGISLTSREIELISKLDTLDSDSLTQSFRMNFGGGNYREGHVGIPLTIDYESDDMITNQIKDQFTGSLDQGLSSMVFYLNNDIRKDLKISINLTFTGVYRTVSDLSNDAFFKVLLETYNNGLNLDIVQSKRRTLFEVLGDGNVVNYFFNQTTTTINFNETITLEEGESLSLQWYGAARFGGTFDSGRYDVDFKDVSCSINIEEDSIRPNSQTQGVILKDVGNQLIKTLIGKDNRYESNFLTNGDFKLSALTSGFWIRRLFDKKIEISWDEFYKNSKSLFLMGYTIDKIDGINKVIHENIDYFFQNFVSININDRVSDIKRTALSEKAFSSIDVGYKKPSGDNLYEEAQGLDEPNIRNKFNTPITKTQEVYDIVSDFRTDSYGKEFARRKSIATNPSGDTRYDKTIFCLDLKQGNGDLLEERTWGDDFEELPTGVFSPETITGLRYSPINTLLRHGKVLRSFLNKFVQEKIRFTSSIGNELLTTKPIGGVERQEGSDILINDLDYPLFVNQIIEFKSKVTFELHQQIYGRTQVGGRSINNFFGKVRFINEFGVKEEGYLLELRPNKEGKWKLLKSA